VKVLLKHVKTKILTVTLLAFLVLGVVAVLTPQFAFEIKEIKANPSAPTLSDIGTNRTIAGEVCQFKCKATGATAVDGFIFGHDNDGSFGNETYVDLADGSPRWCLYNLTLNSTVGKQDQWQMWVNNTSDEWATTGLQSFYIDVMAASLTIADVNAAVALVNVSNAEIVYLPAGIQGWDLIVEGIPGAPYGGQIGIFTKDGVSFIGEGNNQTVLYMSCDATYPSIMFYINGKTTSDMITRFSNITLIGYVNASKSIEDAEGMSYKGIKLSCCENFRVDHCIFKNWVGTAVSVDVNIGSGHPKGRGVVDHCNITNPYKAERGGVWAYGVGFGGNNIDWHETIDYLGNYGGDNNVANVMFVENCFFNNCRHAVSSGSSKGWYVCRFNNMEQQGGNSIVDMHAITRGAEIYNNTIFNTGGYGYGIGVRGGSAYIFNNTIHDVGTGISLSKEFEDWPVNDTYIWDNNIYDVNLNFSAAEYEEGVDYWLYEREGYKSYPYPHPLTYDGDLLPSWDNTGFNSTMAGAACELSSYWDDDSGLSHYAVEHNGTGATSWLNGTFGATPEWVNKTITLPSSGVVAWRTWANDSAGNWTRFCWSIIWASNYIYLHTSFL